MLTTRRETAEQVVLLALHSTPPAVSFALACTLESGRAVVDEYVARGLRTLHRAPLDASRVAPQAWAEIGYTAEGHLDFYRDTRAAKAAP